MKKIIVRIGGIFLAIGCVLALIGWFSGGKQKLLHASFDSQTTKYKNTTNKLESFDRIHATLPTADLQIKSGKSFQIETKGINPKYVKYHVKNNQLDLKQSDHFEMSFFNISTSSSPDSKITITVPEKTTLKSSVISAGEGDVTFSHTDFDKLSAKLSEGDFNSTKNTLKDSTIKSDEGDVDFTNTRLANLEAILAEGDFSAKKGSFKGNNSISVNEGDSTISGIHDAAYHLSGDEGDNSLFDNESSHNLSSKKESSNKVFVHTDEGDNTVK